MLSQLTSDLLSPEEKEIFVQRMKKQSFTLITNQSVQPCPSIVYDVNTLDKYLDCNQITEQFMEARWYIIEKLLSDHKKTNIQCSNYLQRFARRSSWFKSKRNFGFVSK